MARGDTTLEDKQLWMRERYAVRGAAPHPPPLSSSLAEGLYAERHYSVSEVAALWHLSQDAVRKLFQNEPGVLVLGGTGSLHKRRYTTLRIPESVLQRLHRRLSRA